MIKVIQGAVGVKLNGRNAVRTTDDPPFSLSGEAEARLVRLGVAAYYSSGAMGPDSPGNAPGISGRMKKNADAEPDGSGEGTEAGDAGGGNEENGSGEDADLDSMSYADIRKLAKQMGLPAGGSRSSILARIRAADDGALTAASPE